MADQSETRIIDDAEVLRKLQELHEKLSGGFRPLMNDIGETLLESIQYKFEIEGRPKWDALSDKSTIPQRMRTNRWPGNILNREGAAGLLGSLNYKADNTSVAVGTNKIYATTMHYGATKGQFGTHPANVPAHTRTLASGRNIRVKAHTRRMTVPWGNIPPRPFLDIEDEDVDAVKESILSFMTGDWE